MVATNQNNRVKTREGIDSGFWFQELKITEKEIKIIEEKENNILNRFHLDIYQSCQSLYPFYDDQKFIGYPTRLPLQFIESGFSSILKTQSIYSIPGIYFLFNNDELIYIGMSKNIGHRIWQHYKRNKPDKSQLVMDFNYVYCLSYEDCIKKYCKPELDMIQELKKWESKFIRRFMPKHNRLLRIYA